MLNSINTNVGAMIALQSLNAVNRELFTVQNRISTGLKIASARDNPAVWAIAQAQRGESRALESVKGSLQRGQAIADVALAAGESISDLLLRMKEKMLAASDTSLNATDKALLNTEYVALRQQIDRAANLADFNGVNLISAGSSGQIKALANTSATSTIDIAHEDLTTSGSALSGILADLTGTVTSTEIAALDAGIRNVSGALTRIGIGSRALERHFDFVGKLQDTIDASVGRLVDADLAKESARLQALQVKQQLALQALQIANRQPSFLLQLFQR